MLFISLTDQAAFFRIQKISSTSYAERSADPIKFNHQVLNMLYFYIGTSAAIAKENKFRMSMTRTSGI